MQIGIALRAMPGEFKCGDQGAWWQQGGKIILIIADGLGHGEQAEKAANAAIAYVAENIGEPLQEIFAGCDRAIRHTRGVAMGMAEVDQNLESLTYAGLGNTRICVWGAQYRRLSSDYGIVGSGYRKLIPQTVPLYSNDLVVMYTDGLPEFFDHSVYKESIKDDVQTLADTLLHDWAKAIDDAGVLVFRK